MHLAPVDPRHLQLAGLDDVASIVGAMLPQALGMCRDCTLDHEATPYDFEDPVFRNLKSYYRKHGFYAELHALSPGEKAHPRPLPPKQSVLKVVKPGSAVSQGTEHDGKTSHPNESARKVSGKGRKGAPTPSGRGSSS
ncbi:hypothetical protein DIPPA_09140 [Diplonema papillatum]|nr:hypothetical protein DIPPA_09140 [Diplonema papillatum]